MPSVWVLYYERFDDFSIDSVYASEALASIARDVEVKRDMRLQGGGMWAGWTCVTPRELGGQSGNILSLTRCRADGLETDPEGACSPHRQGFRSLRETGKSRGGGDCAGTQGGMRW